MRKHLGLELPIRSKLNMLDDIVQVIHFLHTGDRQIAVPLMDDLKARAVFFDDQIQHDVLIFCEQVCFQYDYDPWHKITPDVQKAADKLIDDLGFSHIPLA